MPAKAEAEIIEHPGQLVRIEGVPVEIRTGSRGITKRSGFLGPAVHHELHPPVTGARSGLETLPIHDRDGAAPVIDQLPAL